MGIKLIKISVVYLVIGTVVGMYMSITHNMALAQFHSHISCLGWSLLALSGIFYHLFPELEQKVLSKIYFWMINIGLPIMHLGLIIMPYNYSGGTIAVISVGATLVSVGIVLFAITILSIKGREKV